jgi:hypothetical protein
VLLVEQHSRPQTAYIAELFLRCSVDLASHYFAPVRGSTVKESTLVEEKEQIAKDESKKE